MGDKIILSITKLLSRLPISFLYIISDVNYFIINYILSYRKDIITKNLKLSFPTYSHQEIVSIRNKFYRHLSDILVEGIKNLTASEKFLHDHLQCENPEILDNLYKRKRNVLLVSGHYSNWEYVISYQSKLFPHRAYGLGTKLRNAVWDKFVTRQRERYGMKVIYGNNVNEVYCNSTDLHATLLLADQSSGSPEKAYWMKFLNQDTDVRYGAELLAVRYNMAVVFFHTKKVRRGKYEIELKLITDDPRSTKYGEITESHTKMLEEIIVKEPHYWLWSHKRWKRKKPLNYDDLYNQYKAKFDNIF